MPWTIFCSKTEEIFLKSQYFFNNSSSSSIEAANSVLHLKRSSMFTKKELRFSQTASSSIDLEDFEIKCKLKYQALEVQAMFSSVFQFLLQFKRPQWKLAFN